MILRAEKKSPSAFRQGLLIAILAGCACGCSVFKDYNQEMAAPRTAFASGDLDGARNEIFREMKGEGGSEEGRLNPWLELGMVDHTAGAFGSSNQALSSGLNIILDYENAAVISATKMAAKAATLVVSEKVKPYYGESFEKILLHTFLALNYLMENEWDKARVETRRAWQRQGEAAREHEKELAEAHAENDKATQKIDIGALVQKLDEAYQDQDAVGSRVANAYQNAFTHYLSAVVYFTMKEYNETYVELKRAEKLRPGAPCLGPLIIETAVAGGFREDLPKWEAAFGIKADDVLATAKEYPAELIVVFENGWAPRKEQIRIPIPTPVGIVMISIPKYRPLPGAANALTVEAGERKITTTLMGDIEAQAARALRDRMTAYVIKMIVRATARTLVEREMQQKARAQAGEAGAMLAFVASSAANIVLEKADLRAWSLLPRELQVARLRLAEGPTQILVRADGGAQPAQATVSMELRNDTPGIILARFVDGRLTVLTNQDEATPPPSN